MKSFLAENSRCAKSVGTGEPGSQKVYRPAESFCIGILTAEELCSICETLN
jgi:hypothetical protein